MPDVVVVGGGVVGASAGYNLAREGVDVTLVDPFLDGAATAAAAGVITALVTSGKHDSWYEYAFPAMQYYPDLVAELEELGITDHSYRRLGDLTVTIDEDGVEALEQTCAARQKLVDRFGDRGIGCTRMVDPDEIREISPLIENVVAGIWHDDVANVDGRSFRAALHEAMRMKGGQVRQGHATLHASDGRIVGVGVDGETLDTDSVILAAGSWSSQLVRDIGLELDVYPQRGQITHAHLPGCGALPVVSGVNRHYLLSYPGDRIVFGATREDEAGFEYASTIAGLQENIREVARVIPSIFEARFIETRIGFRPFTQDAVPHIGAASAIEGLYLGAGLSTQGLTIGALTGQRLARLAAGEKTDIPAEFAPRI